MLLSQQTAIPIIPIDFTAASTVTKLLIFPFMRIPNWSHHLVRWRVQIGLADPLVADRFLLFGLWSAAGLANLGADVVSRLIYVAAGGAGHPDVPGLLRSIAIGTMSATMVLGVVSAVTLFLAFFPTQGYRRWVVARAARTAA